jgi:hypothetical protein
MVCAAGSRPRFALVLTRPCEERDFFIDHLMVQSRSITEMIYRPHAVGV